MGLRWVPKILGELLTAKQDFQSDAEKKMTKHWWTRSEKIIQDREKGIYSIYIYIWRWSHRHKKTCVGERKRDREKERKIETIVQKDRVKSLGTAEVSLLRAEVGPQEK